MKTSKKIKIIAAALAMSIIAATATIAMAQEPPQSNLASPEVKSDIVNSLRTKSQQLDKALNQGDTATIASMLAAVKEINASVEALNSRIVEASKTGVLDKDTVSSITTQIRELNKASRTLSASIRNKRKSDANNLKLNLSIKRFLAAYDASYR